MKYHETKFHRRKNKMKTLFSLLLVSVMFLGLPKINYAQGDVGHVVEDVVEGVVEAETYAFSADINQLLSLIINIYLQLFYGRTTPSVPN